MKAYFPLILCFAILTNMTFGQVKDSIGVSILKVPSSEIKNDLYEVRIINLRADPICIMHSAYVKLFFDPPQRLALANSNRLPEIFSLHYVARDTMNDYELTNSNYDAEPILPYQDITFRLFVPRSEKEKRILFEYLVLPDFCYKDFEQAIYNNATTWYEKYIKKEFTFDLPK